MMIEITLPIVLQIVQTLGILVGIIYYITIMRNTQKTRELTLQSQELTRKAQEQTLETRQTQIFMQIFQHLNSEESLKSWAELVNQIIPDHDEFLMKYDSRVNPAHYAKRASHWYAYNTIGELLQSGLIELDLLIRLKLDTQVILMWENWEEIIRATRVKENIPDIWDGFEFLYNEMKKFRSSRGYPEITYPPPS
jgi:hypothetical protein